MRPTRAAGICFGLLLIAGLWTTPASAQVHIEDVRVGFGYPTSGGAEGNYKIGDWAPVRVKLRAEKEGFSGALELSTTDSDDVEAVFLRRVSLAPNETIDVTTFAKPGKQMPEYHVRLLDESGKIRDRDNFDTSSGRAWDGAMQSTTLIVAVGRPAGLDAEQFAKRPGFPRENFRIAHLETTRELPARWYGFEAVDHLILCLDNPAQLEGMDVTARAALEAWVRHGGHLVVSVGTSWERVLADTVLGPMLPVEIDRTETVKQLSELESYVSSAPPMRFKDPLSIPHLANPQGKIVVGTRDLPLVVQAPYGLGFVTFVALELNHEPFSGWDGRTDFWLNLLAIRKQPPQDSNAQAAWGQRALSDISSYLRVQLEHFEGVSLVPFQWVAFFIFLYILLIGPVDYLLVKKVLKRMELTWVTFPTMVVGVSLAAYFTAYWLKGDELRINKIDVVDVDQAGKGEPTLRGTTWFTLFSPQIKNYTVKIEPDLAIGPQAPGQQGGPSVTVSWLGLAEDAIGGMGRPGGVGLFRRGYRFGPDAQSLEDVPVQVWSMKGFSARWHGTATATVEAKLESIDLNRVKGTLTNRLGAPLEDCSLVFGRKVYPLGNLPINGSVVVEKRTTEELNGHLTRRAAPFVGTQARYPGAYNQPSQFNPNDLVFTMMFHARLPEGNQFAANDYFNDLDLSEQLDHQRAILVGRVHSKGSKLILNDSEVNENVQRSCYLRVILPVAKGSPEAPFEPSKL